MKTTTFSNLSCKEVVNCKDGKIIGYVNDLKLDTESAGILSLFVKPHEKLLGFTKKSTIEIPFENVEKIGQDIILVNLPPHQEIFGNSCKKEKKKLFGDFH